MSKMIIITAPSGAGKTTIVRYLLEKMDTLSFSVSATTRTPRKGEVHGKDYYFLTNKAFKKKIRKEKFAEWEEVYPDKFYGTLKKEIKRIWKEKKHIVFDIEVKGATNLKKIYGKKALAIFVKAPSIEELLRRLNKRDTESAITLKERITRAVEEMKYETTFDEVLVNDKLDIALKEAETLVHSFLNQPEEPSKTTKKKKGKKKKDKKPSSKKK